MSKDQVHIVHIAIILILIVGPLLGLGAGMGCIGYFGHLFRKWACFAPMEGAAIGHGG